LQATEYGLSYQTTSLQPVPISTQVCRANTPSNRKLSKLRGKQYQESPQHPTEAIRVRMGVDHRHNRSFFDMPIDELQRGPCGVLTRKRINDNPPFCTAYESDIGDVVPAYLPNAIAHLEQPMVCVEHSVSPEIRVDGVGRGVALTQKVEGLNVEHPTPLRPVDRRRRQRCDVATANPLKICRVGHPCASCAVHGNGVTACLAQLPG